MQMSDPIPMQVERAALRAFPALEEAGLNGWLLRFANGQSRRANSVQTLSHSGDLASDVAAAEAWYGKRGIPGTFRMTPMSQPAGLDSELEASAYRRQDPTSVQKLHLAGKGFAANERIEITDSPTSTWFDIIMESSRYMAGRRPTLEQTLRMIEPQTAFALLREAGRPVATGLAVADGDLVGLFSIAVLPQFRRAGYGRAMSESLLGWGLAAGASIAYLQVMHVNTPALDLYRSMGFEPIYDYWYRSLADRPPMVG